MKQTNWVCIACGTQFPSGSPVPALCPVCADDRQFIPSEGQQWTDMQTLAETHDLEIKPLAFPDEAAATTSTAAGAPKDKSSLISLKLRPAFGIGNRALLVLSPSGNILWDCLPLLNEKTIRFIHALGGLQAIAISHPHYYGNMNDWAAAFQCPIYIHHLDRSWVMQKGPGIRYWEGDDFALPGDLRIVHTGGHFDGSSVLEIPWLSRGGTVLCGDTLYVARSKKHTAVMYSYPNQILLEREAFAAFEKKMSAIRFDSLIGAFEHQWLSGHAREIYDASMKKYKAAYLL